MKQNNFSQIHYWYGVCHAFAFVAVLHFFSAADKADFITGLGKALGEFSKERGAVLSRT